MKNSIKGYFIKFFLKILTIIYKLVKRKNGRICIIDETPKSGSNAQAIYNYITKEANYKDIFITRKYIGRGMSLREMYLVASSHVYICTHRSFKVSKDRVCIQAWHGIPIKGMNYMDRGEGSLQAEIWHKEFNRCDYVLSSSNLYEVLMSSCFGIPRSKFVKTGFPRTDLLVKPNKTNRDSLLALFEANTVDSETKIIFYLPTFRIGHKKGKIEGELKKGNIFGFKDYDLKEIELNLKVNNCVCIAKLHPMEEKLLPIDKLIGGGRIKVINSEWLDESKNDLYNFLSVSDMLITDYSSVYFDYLILNRPIIFINNDLSQYRLSRSLLLEPYDFWTPGYKVNNQHQLINSISSYCSNPGLYTKERKLIKSMLFEADSYNNCERIWKDLIKPIVNK